nr:hypothetical protein [Tanacetum cinerariifolium]
MLRKFMEKKSIFIVLKLVIHWELINVEQLKRIQSPPYKLEHVELNARSVIWESPVYIALLNVLLWCFWPRSLTTKLGYCINKSDVVKFMLISYFVPEQKFSDLNSLLKLAVSLDDIRKITFIKEE